MAAALRFVPEMAIPAAATRAGRVSSTAATARRKAPWTAACFNVREPYLHYAFSKGWSHWLRKHDEYSTLEARDRLARGAGVRWRDVLSRDGSVRNRALKPLVSRLPGWPLLRFLHMYLVKRGFLEGRAGLVYCVNMAYYEFLILLKMREKSAALLPTCRRENPRVGVSTTRPRPRASRAVQRRRCANTCAAPDTRCPC